MTEVAKRSGPVRDDGRLPGRIRIFRAGPLPEPWAGLSYGGILARPGGELVNDGRSSRVHLFRDGPEACYLKRYRYRKIHWRHCFEKSQVQREYENLASFRRAGLACETIEILAWGERRRGRILLDAFLLSRAVPGGVRLSLFLANEPDHPCRAAVVEQVIAFGAQLIESRLALCDLFFRNLVVVPESARLHILDLQRCSFHNPGRAARKSWPQLWADIEIFFTPRERQQAAARFRPLLTAAGLAQMVSRARHFLPKERKRRAQEQALAASTDNRH
jgi:hypothetical protein